MHINSIVFLNILHQHFMFATVSIIKNRKIKNIEDGIKQAHKLYLRYGFKITHINSDNKFENIWSKMTDLGISLNFIPNK